MAFTGSNYTRMKADRNIGIALAPTGGATGVVNVYAPQEAELVYGGSRGTLNAAPAVSWNDYDLGVQESERTSDPSLADDSTFEDFGQKEYGGSLSMYYPRFYNDTSNDLSNVYDLTEHEWTLMDVIQRIDGAKDNDTPMVDGDFVHVMRTITDGEDNTLTGEEALRRTVNFVSQGEVAVYTVVGDHTLTAIEPPTDPWAAGNKARLRVTIQDRDVTNMDVMSYFSSDPDVVRVYPGGFYEVTGPAGSSTTINITDTGANTSTTVNVTVT